MRSQITPHQRERRLGLPPVPEALDTLLTSAQRQGLDQAISFGWELVFVRHPLFQDFATVVVTRDHGGTYATISADGELEFNPDLPVRH
jgi:hypothetical protein